METSSVSVTFAPPKPHSNLSFDSKIVEDYILTEMLGQGSCAIVKLGVHRLTGEEVAVKIVRPSTMQKQKEILREIEALRTLGNHPHIIKLHKVIRENGFVCIILELGKGGEMFNYILNNGRLTEAHARKLFRQVVSGLLYCHANLIVHRDLKPENIMLDTQGDVKISDFGLSNFIRPNNLFSTFCGSPIYTPPEIVLHKKYNGALSDVWSLGVILFVMVTGGMPWRLENNKVQNMEALLSAHFRLPDSLGLSEDCKDLIRNMLVADTQQRATIEEIANHPWVNRGYDSTPETYLPAQSVVPQAEINYGLLEQLTLLGMSVSSASVAIQSDPYSPALTAYRSLLAKQGGKRKVVDDMFNLGDVPEAPPSPSRIRAQSDPAADRLKMEKTRLEEIRRESEAQALDSVREKERIREKIKKWKAMHKSPETTTTTTTVFPSKDVTITTETTNPVTDKSRGERFKSFFSHFRRHTHSNTNSMAGTTSYYSSGSSVAVRTASTTTLPRHPSPSTNIRHSVRL